MYQCTIDGTDARKQPDDSQGAQKYFSWNKIGTNNYCVRYRPSVKQTGLYDPKIENNLNAGPVGYCNGNCNGNINPEESVDLGEKGFAFKNPQCDWDNNDCYANVGDTTTIPQPTYLNPNPVTYLYAQNTNYAASNGESTVCFTDNKPLSTHYKNMGRTGDFFNHMFDPRFRYSHPYPKITPPASVTTSNLCVQSNWINPPSDAPH